MSFKHLALILAFLLPLSALPQCQQRTMMGTDFWVAFCANSNSGPNVYSFIVAAPRQCVVTISNGNDNYPNVFSVDTIPAGSAVNITVPYYLIFHVTSTDSIALYASNFNEASWDITTVLPTHALRNHYIIQTYNHLSIQGYDPEFRCVTTELFTHDTIFKHLYNINDSHYNPTITTYAYYEDIRPSFRMMYCNIGQSLSGTEIHSDKPVAVFQGHECARIPSDYGACDHLYEQVLPLDYWGTDFLLVPTAERGYRERLGFDIDSNVIYGDIIMSGNGDMVMVTSSADDCILWLDGRPIDTLLRGETTQLFIPPDTCRRLVASRPVATYLYLCGEGFSGEFGDPAVVLVPPLEQGVSTSFFASISTDRTRRHYANIVARTRDVPFMMLDYASIAGDFIPFDTLYSYARINVDSGAHLLECINGGRFVAHFYGLGDAESYAYVAGMSLNDLSHLYVAGNVRQRLADGVRACVDDTLVFQITTTLQDTVTQWFVDGMTVVGDSSLLLPYSFQVSGTHHVAAVVNGQLCDTLRTNVYISPWYGDTVVASICNGVSFHWNDTVITDSGFYSFNAASSIGCDSICSLDLSLSDIQRTDIYDTVCANAYLSWHGRNLSEEGIYFDTLTASDGCDTVVTLHLTVNPLNPIDIFDTACLSSPYNWSGHSFTSEGIYFDTLAADTLVATDACDTIATLHLSAIPSPNIAIDISGGCSGYSLTANTDAPYVEWSSFPLDSQLAYQSSNTTVSVSPDSSSTTYTLLADYSPEFLCPSSKTVTLSPVLPIVADFRVVPPVVTTDNLEFQLIDQSVGSTSTAWIVNGERVGESPILSLTADPNLDSLNIMLVATNDVCSDTAYFMLPIVRLTLWVPNAFTPDMQSNRVFMPVGEGVVSGELYIFNRQGLLVAYQPDYRLGWDGTYNPPATNPESTSSSRYQCPQATYVWLLVYRTIDAPSVTRKAKGTVTLIR